MSLEEKNTLQGDAPGSQLCALLTLGGGGGVKFCLLGWVNFTLGPISAIRRAPTHQDTIEQGALRTVLSAYELLRAEITGYGLTLFVRYHF